MAGNARRPTGSSRRSLPGDAGLSLIEMLVAITLVGTVMTAAATFFVGSLAVLEQQSGKQVAVQVADSAVELVRALKGSAVAEGRDLANTQQQWATPVAGVAGYLAEMRQYPQTQAESDSQNSTANPLPIAPVTVTVNGVAYEQHWYLGKCWQALGGGTCSPNPTFGPVEYFKVVVAILWPDSHCGAGTCSYVTSTMVSSASRDPTFNTGSEAQPLQIGASAALVDPSGTVGEAVSIPLGFDGGTTPYAWSATGLPTGVTINATTGRLTGTLTRGTRFLGTVRLTDGKGNSDSLSFVWEVKLTANGLRITDPTGDRTGDLRGTTPVVTPIVRGGTGTGYVWSAPAGLPPGMTINTTTGVVSGTLITPGVYEVTLLVRDSAAATATFMFTWSVS